MSETKSIADYLLDGGIRNRRFVDGSSGDEYCVMRIVGDHPEFEEVWIHVKNLTNGDEEVWSLRHNLDDREYPYCVYLDIPGFFDTKVFRRCKAHGGSKDCLAYSGDGVEELIYNAELASKCPLFTTDFQVAKETYEVLSGLRF